MRHERLRIIGMISLLSVILFFMSSAISLRALTIDADAVYFSSRFCESCQNLEADGTIKALENQGFVILKYVLEDDTNHLETLRNFQHTYGIPLGSDQVPILFIGETYVTGRTAINEAFQSGRLVSIMETTSLLEIDVAPASDFSLITFILLGVVDGVNPCAIAMLLLFISLLSFTSDKRVLILVSLTFISAIFISYFLFGTLLYQTLSSFGAGSLLVTIVPYVVMGLAFILFILNSSDFIFASRKRYDKVKNQLPSRIQRFNKRLMTKFTKTLESGSPMIYVVTFMIGIIISVTEFLCTGQAYLTAILHLIHFTDFLGRGILLLMLYNLIFVMPLILIAVIAVMTRTIKTLSAFMREHLHLVKLFTALVFLMIFIYYVIELF
ncbi:MAG: hypothetical protein K9K93_03305 [Acholeplasmataceae bacterium]|nr:hypothetical protein [Acholeplasmataceae bacterium]